ETAHGGTVLLDEIGDMPLELQVKLLSVTEDRAIQRVGGDRHIPVDVRIIAATHQDLESAVEQGRFREDLYYRLKVVTIRIPTL
ncbi:MAG: sigma-54-dependent Fis family transcriptional regulator, partial [Xanthomonadales bacterium]|nr:sigma-54-dependent Fis family transcriptional regulator [Xanthomonadales bacterium]NIO14184.1 sigma-54-dependent Fis family transcriptional regulator [Xanthomonadales bacterium]